MKKSRIIYLKIQTMNISAVMQYRTSFLNRQRPVMAAEYENPQYILDLLLSVIAVSVNTADIVTRLPKVEWE